MFQKSFEERIYEKEFNLNDTDDTIIDYIREHIGDLQRLSIQNIAKDLFVSPNAIMRTAKKLGYTGFSELKFSLQKEKKRSISTINELSDNPESPDMEKFLLKKVPQNIIKTLDIMEDNSIKTTVDTIIKANKILFAGLGDSAYFCELFGKHLRCMGKNVEYYQHIYDMEYAIKNFGKGDLVFIISTSGSNKLLLNIARDTTSRSIDTFCITHYSRNPLSQICNKQLCFWGERRVVNGYNVTDKSGLMMLVRLLCEEYWQRI